MWLVGQLGYGCDAPLGCSGVPDEMQPAQGLRRPNSKGELTCLSAVWSKKRERQYDHIKDGLLERGEDEDTAEEIAARTVNKERAGRVRRGNRAALRPRTSPRAAVAGCARTRVRAAATRNELYEEARDKNVKGRSKMNKAELERAVGR